MVILVNLKLFMIHRSNKIVVELVGRINKVGVISPRYDIKMKDFENWC